MAPGLLGALEMALLPPTDAPLTAGSKALLLPGLFYFGLGLAVILLPPVERVTGLFYPRELSTFRFWGVVLWDVGYFHLQDGRTNSRFLVGSWVFASIFLVPPLYLLMARLGARLYVCLALSAASSAFGVLTLLVWRERPSVAGFFELVFGLPAGPLTPAHQFLLLQGLLYAIFGIAFSFFPETFDLIFALFGEEKVEGAELEALRLPGAQLIVIGYSYLQGARENTDFFVVSRIFHRLTVIVAFSVVLSLLGTRASITIVSGGIDVVLALLTYFVWAGQAGGQGHALLNDAGC